MGGLRAQGILGTLCTDKIRLNCPAWALSRRALNSRALGAHGRMGGLIISALRQIVLELQVIP